MEYALDPLDKLVSELIGISRKPAGSFTEAGATELLQTLALKTGTIQNDLIKQVFQLSKAKEIERFIQRYQVVLTSFLDRLYQQDIILPAQPSALRRAYDGFYQTILEMLSFIEERFSKCFDTREKVPDVYFALTVSEMEAEGNEIFKQERYSELDSAALDLVAASYQLFLQNSRPRKTISYLEVIYRKMLLNELKDLPQHPEQGNGNSFSVIEQILIYTNFNDKEFVQYMADRLAAAAKEPEDLKDKISLILIYSKDLHQLPLKPESALLPGHPSLMEQLSTWLSEELYFLERRMNMFAISGTQTTLSEKKAFVECRVPVDQLGIFFRAATETKLLSTSSQKKLFEQIAPYLSTPRRQRLSPDSMRSKSYSPERKDIEGVKDLLMIMFRQVGKY